MHAAAQVALRRPSCCSPNGIAKRPRSSSPSSIRLGVIGGAFVHRTDHLGVTQVIFDMFNAGIDPNSASPKHPLQRPPPLTSRCCTQNFIETGNATL